MGKSAAYARIRGEVFDTVNRVPAGRVTTYPAIGDFWNVVPRHVAYILATLTDEERALLPWHRVVRADGTISPTHRGTRGEAQKALLAEEGVTVDSEYRIDAFSAILWLPTQAVTPSSNF
jgi:methylated-DNA-protein-cysteine methyltransferase related protein